MRQGHRSNKEPKKPKKSALAVKKPSTGATLAPSRFAANPLPVKK